MKLTNTQCKNAQPKTKVHKLADGGGLYLLVKPNGAKHWRLKYRFLGKEKLLAIGPYPLVSLAEARERRDEAKKLLAAGKDPINQKQDKKRQAVRNAQNTFKAVALEWHENQKDAWSEHHALNVMRRLEIDIFPYIGNKPIADIDAQTLLYDVIKRVEDRKAFDVASRVKQICGQIFRYGIITRKCSRDVAADLKGAMKSYKKGHYHCLEIKEMPEFLAALEENKPRLNVGNEVYIIETERTKSGGTIKANQQVEKRERLSRKKRWEHQDEDEVYSSTQLDRDIVNPDQIRTVIRTFRDKLPEIFPGRKEVPKTLIFAKTDSHADDIIQTVREEFGEGNEFCKKITYQAKEDPKSILAQFRNSYNPRIAVTVDMIATGTDVRPLECLLFMRDVKSRNYFEQMKGRGTRTLDHDDLKKVTPSATSAKTHYVIVDAIGVTKSLKTASQPLITKPTVPMKDLAMSVMMGARDDDTISSLAGRLARLNKQLNDKDQTRICEQTGGVKLSDIVSNLLAAIDPDTIEVKAQNLENLEAKQEPSETARTKARENLMQNAVKVFNGELVELLDTIRRDKEQTIDHINLDKVLTAEWAGDSRENAENLTKDFQEYLEQNRDTIEALTIYYRQPYRRQDVTFDMIQKVMEKLRADRPKLAPARVWMAYALLDDYKGEHPANELTTLIALIRRACGIDKTVSGYSDTVRRNFQNWIMKRHSGSGQKFNEDQMAWLHMIRDHVINSFHIEKNDLETAPFDSKGGMGKMYQLFGDQMEPLMNELNEALAA